MTISGFDANRLLDRRPDPDNFRSLWDWLMLKIRMRLAIHPTCTGHHSPYQILQYKYKHKPATSIVHGPRGGGKSMMAALFAHLNCRWQPRYRVKILGGSKQQSAQVYEALGNHVVAGRDGFNDAGPVKSLMAEKAVYHNGSSISMLAASTRSARGPHSPHLILDEVEEQNPDVMDGAIGIVQEYPEEGFSPIIEMLSTYHKIGGLMDKKLEQARQNETPIFKFCIFEVMERCPDSFSGRHYENCPQCPLFAPCWADRLNDRRALPRAKRAGGHYTLKTVLQKMANVSPRVFEADYLCMGPRSDGVWFVNYSDTANVCPDRGEYDPRFRVHVPIDYGVHTCGVFFQIKKFIRNGMPEEDVAIFAEHYAESLTPAENAERIRAVADRFCGGRMDRMSMDSAANGREPVGTTGRNEYYRAGFHKVKPWAKVKSRKDNLEIIDTFVKTADGRRHLFVHPRCTGMRRAFMQYARARVAGVWTDDPKDPQHPEEEYIDALAGGLNAHYPLGREPAYNRGAVWLPGNRAV